MRNLCHAESDHWIKRKGIASLIQLFIISALFFVFPVAVKSADFYVDAKHGSDETGDGSQERPWKRLAVCDRFDPRHGRKSPYDSSS